MLAVHLALKTPESQATFLRKLHVVNHSPCLAASTENAESIVKSRHQRYLFKVDVSMPLMCRVKLTLLLLKHSAQAVSTIYSAGRFVA